MRMEFAGAIRGRYAAAANKDKSRILEEFVAATGYHEKSAIRISHAWPPVTSLVRQPVTELREATRKAWSNGSMTRRAVGSSRRTTSRRRLRLHFGGRARPANQGLADQRQGRLSHHTGRATGPLRIGAGFLAPTIMFAHKSVAGGYRRIGLEMPCCTRHPPLPRAAAVKMKR